MGWPEGQRNSKYKTEQNKPTVSIHVVITGISSSIPISVPLVIVQDSPAVVTGIPKDIFITVPLVYVVSQDTVVLNGGTIEPLLRLPHTCLTSVAAQVCPFYILNFHDSYRTKATMLWERGQGA